MKNKGTGCSAEGPGTKGACAVAEQFALRLVGLEPRSEDANMVDADAGDGPGKQAAEKWSWQQPGGDDIRGIE